VCVFAGDGEVRARVVRAGLRPRAGPLLRGATLREALHGVTLARAHAEVTISNAHARYALVPEAGGLRNDAERQAAGVHALAQTFGELAHQWDVAADRAGVLPQLLAAGIPARLREEIEGALREAGATSISIQPALARAVNRTRAGDKPGWLALIEASRIVLAAFAGGALLALRTQRIRGTPEGDLLVMLQQSRLLDGMPADAQDVIACSEEASEDGMLEDFRLHAVALDFTALQPLPGRADRLHVEFGRPAPVLRAGDLAWLACGVAALGISLWQYGQVAGQSAELRSVLAEADRFSQRQMAPAFDPNRPDARALAADVARANAVAARLQVPWDALFSDLEVAGGEGVTLLGFEPEGGMRRLRISGEARRFEDLTQYLRRLEGTPAFRNVFLTAHELRDRGLLTFTLTADWVRSDEPPRP
jgi:hypothetical protein